MKYKLDKETVSGYAQVYNPSKLLEKLGKVARKAGAKVVYAVLLLYYALLDGDVPLKDKAIVVGALGYFILPFDFIPDMLGPLGFSDDMGALILALKTIWSNITPKVKEQARQKLSEWFDEVDPEELKLF
ncbi:MAG: DUF1232 domain-containing protein [Bacteroides sp.]|nr:DUF1232 domain-containing protein [Bacteroides sp.]